MAKKSDIPQFGVLSDVTVVSATVSTAGPFAGELMAEMGADVIWIESALAPDVNRLPNAFSVGLAAECERRNQRTISLNIPTPEGKEVLFRLLKKADIFIESSKGGQYDRWGLNDETLWEVNPALVIVHLSGFGQFGDPQMVSRGCYDPIAQAFSGYMALQGWPDRDPNPAHYITSDYFAGWAACTAALGALHKVRQTGQGESVDIAQYEVALRCQANKLPEYLNHHVQTKREGSRNQIYAGWGSFKCKDGKYVYILILGTAIIKKAVNLLGLEYGSEAFPEGIGGVLHNTPGAELLDAKLEELCAAHTAQEVSDLLWPNGVPCTLVMQYADMRDNPHYKARGSIVEWPAVEGSAYEGQNVRGPAFPLRFKRNPSQIWRGGPTIGMDNEDILAETGFTPEEIASLYEKKVLRKDGPAVKKFKIVEQ